MSDFLTDALKVFDAIAAGPPPRLALDEIGDGISVSTINSRDQGPETAICDVAGAHPVERYASVEDALEGHKRWVEKAPTLTEITKLGYGAIQGETQVTLERESD